ncbi:uncharacterized protein LOC107267265 isoform X2 [Cephus cinctus]|uniref:Uncharacterized protein LOC107267265 isoform X2 n=1 Tax=Cephus cinctus TaxID=211228 RepID=A0AAJ7BU24_CEPCN|nr:uncharacterized protein LOC107267265 isoform X2 [Cephus cinctus]
MGKKGSKRKTRWRTLSIGAPPGEEDEEDGLRNGYVRGQENGSSSRTFDRNAQTNYKPRRTYTGNTSGYGSSSSRSRKDDSADSPSQPKIIFNEDEYTRITTPRQDVLFKKGYLSQKKPWASTASTSATPSTTESQSASHSTADGSETTEDQQLLDRDSAAGEFPPVIEMAPPRAYGTIYDHNSGYYYEYPLMIVGPPVPSQVGPNVLAAVPCGPVPLRPIEWVNPAFVPRLASNQYGMVDYQVEHSPEIAMDPGTELINAEAANGNESESGTANGVESGADEEPTEDTIEEPVEEVIEEPLEEVIENGPIPFMDPAIAQPIHIPHIPPGPQQYMYPGHFMFGPSLVNVNGVTIQTGPMVRSNDAAVTTAAAAAKRRKKKKRRKQKRLAQGNTEDEEEEEYSSDCDPGATSSRLPWAANSSKGTTTSTSVHRPLNPECQEFQLRSIVQPEVSAVANNSDAAVVPDVSSIEESPPADCSSGLSGPLQASSLGSVETTSESIETTSTSTEALEISGKIPNNVLDKSNGDMLKNNTSRLVSESINEDSSSVCLNDRSDDLDNDVRRLKDRLDEPEEKVEESKTIGMDDVAMKDNDLLLDVDSRKLSKIDSVNGDENLKQSNGQIKDTEVIVSYKKKSDKIELNSINVNIETSTRPISPSGGSSLDKPCSRPTSPEINKTTTPINAEAQRLPESYESLVTKPPVPAPRRKYSAKGLKFVREPTPGPDLDTETNVDVEEALKAKEEILEPGSTEVVHIQTSTSSVESISVPNELKSKDQEKHKLENGGNKNEIDDQIFVALNDDSSRNIQSRLSDHPITDAVTEWLRKSNSPDIFLTPMDLANSETDEDEEDVMDVDEPPKNLQGNPMPALSANGDVADDEVSSLRVANRGEFARTNIETVKTEKKSMKPAVVGKKRRSKASGRKTGSGSENKTNSKKNYISAHVHEPETKAMIRNGELLLRDVGEVCELTEEDSDAGMRVALSSRMDSEGVDTESTRGTNQDRVKNNEVKIESGSSNGNEKEVLVKKDAVSVKDIRTFERGEIVVSMSGKLLPGASYEALVLDHRVANQTESKNTRRNDVGESNKKEAQVFERMRESSSIEDDVSAMASLGSIEEPDVLECWEAETIEPVTTPKRMMQTRGVSQDGEAAEEDAEGADIASVEHVRKYYRLARESATSLEEEEVNETRTPVSSSKSRTVPNSPERMIESLCSEEIPVIVPAEIHEKFLEKDIVPVDEAFEVYESCYTGKTPFFSLDSKHDKSRPIYGQEEEGPVPCKAVCCNIQ